jgi:hypothetical protein
MAERSELPRRIRDAPQLDIGLELYYQAFWDLTTCRPSGYSVGPIPWSSIKEYSELCELDPEQVEDLFVFIRIMDNAYLDWVERKAKSGKK